MCKRVLNTLKMSIWYKYIIVMFAESDKINWTRTYVEYDVRDDVGTFEVGGGSYVLEEGSRKGGFVRPPPEPPGYGHVPSVVISLVRLTALIQSSNDQFHPCALWSSFGSFDIPQIFSECQSGTTISIIFSDVSKRHNMH